jgi:DNA-binding transcriptional ArsR family regulator
MKKTLPGRSPDEAVALLAQRPTSGATCACALACAAGTLCPLSPLAGRGVIAEKAPGSLDELARITGKAKSNLSRTLRTMEGYGLVRLERGERGRITPKVMHDRVELDLPLTLSRKAS